MLSRTKNKRQKSQNLGDGLDNPAALAESNATQPNFQQFTAFWNYTVSQKTGPL